MKIIFSKKVSLCSVLHNQACSSSPGRLAARVSGAFTSQFASLFKSLSKRHQSSTTIWHLTFFCITIVKFPTVNKQTNCLINSVQDIWRLGKEWNNLWCRLSEGNIYLFIAILITLFFLFHFRFHFLTFVYFLNAKKIACKVMKCRT